ncbi:MAG: molybdopterin-dependent oxidoreductase, partial [Chloroflexota bacterium]|nr:molybdopterin-dependent oxidoreductase [Chloroflexota bacterium]
MPDEIELTIDGVKVRTRPGKTVLEAAMEAGIYIPYLCYHPGMKPYAACRMCLVEIEGQRGTPASCTTPVAKDMVVRTSTQQLHDLRKGVNEMLIAEHPHGCLTCHRQDLCGPEDICLRHVGVTDRCVLCPKNERCELKDTTRYLTMEMESPLQYVYRDLPLLTSDPFYDRDYNLCIVCGRCVRVCSEVRAAAAICFVERSGKALVGTSRGTSLLESGCEFCGACIDVCPVGALVERDYKWEKPARVVRTVCPHCSVGCQMNLEVNRFGKVIRAVPELSGPANRGQACFKGKFGMDFVNRKERLRKPLVRHGGALVEATWDEALDYVAKRLPAFRGGAFALLASARNTNEELYLAGKFARAVMASNSVDVDSDSRPELAAPLAETLGYAAATNPIWQLRDAGCILAFNANATEEHNLAAVPVKQAARAGAKLIVIDPREVELTRYATLWLRPRPGTELLLLGGLLKSVVEQGVVKEQWVQEHAEGLDALKAALGAIDLESVARETGVVRESIETAARLYAGARSSAILYALDNVPAALHRDCVLALSDLALLTGNVGRPASGLYPLRQGTNEQGAYDVGCVPGLLPGYRPVSDDQARQELSAAWGVSLPEQDGVGVKDVPAAIREGRVVALVALGAGGAFAQELQACAEKLELLVVQDVFL